jgi:superfamily II DNA or RNA helicase
VLEYDIQSMPPQKELLIIATSQYLGEGFDCPQVDTLFLAFPVKFREKLVQQVDCFLQNHEGKTNVRVYDYLDKESPILDSVRTPTRPCDSRRMVASHEENYGR